MTTYRVPVITIAETTVDFVTDIDPRTDPEGFEKAFYAVDHHFPSANVTNDFKMNQPWELVIDPADGTILVTEVD